MPAHHHRKSINRPGHAHELTFSCYRGYELLSKERTCRWLVGSIKAARQSLHFQLWAYVFMPNHVHLIIRPDDNHNDMPAILKRIKQPVSRKAFSWLEKNSPKWINRLTAQRGQRTERHFWQRGGGYDRNIIEPSTLEKMIRYLHMNPVRKGLVERAIDWQWSSAGWFEQQQPNSLRPDQLPPEWTTGMTDD